jgi:hypothetical protein
MRFFLDLLYDAAVLSYNQPLTQAGRNTKADFESTFLAIIQLVSQLVHKQYLHHNPV